MKSNRVSRYGVIAAAPFAVLAISLAGGCQGGGGGGGESAKAVKLAFVTNNTSEFWKIAGNGVHKYELEGKVQVDIKMPPNGKTEEQNQILREPGRARATTPSRSASSRPRTRSRVLNNVGRRRPASSPSTPTRRTRSGCSTSAPTTTRRARRWATRIVQLLPERREDGGVRRLLLRRQRGAAPKGIEDAIAGHNLEIVEKREDQTDRAKARGNVEDILNARPDVNLVCGLWSYNGPAIAAALEGTGKRGKVLAAVFDEEDGTLKGIKDGTIAATVVQHPYEMGYRSARWMHRLATDFDKAQAEIPADHIENTGVEVIDKATLGDFEQRLAVWKK